jgi:AbrB family looped-hinge helix DNA binding protein
MDMLTAKVTSKGQITIPRQVRAKLGVRPGEGIGFEEKDGIFYIKKAVKKSPFDKWVGRLKPLKGKKSDAIIGELRGK